MTPDRSPAGASRRDLLAACGASLAALAGCSGVDAGPGSALRFDPDRVADVAAMPVPEPPTGFPVEVTDAMVETHLERARERLDAVPPSPAVPNGEVAERLARDRARVREAVAAVPGSSSGGPGRLRRARHVRADAAEVAAAYRAATGRLEPAAVEEAREALRADRLAFEEDWAYRGADAVGALVVHAEVESLLETARRRADAWPPVAAEPVDDPFQAGAAVRGVEAARAALLDARRLDEHHLAGVDEPVSFRAGFTVVAHRLEHRTRYARHRVQEFLERGPNEAGFGRSLDGTPALHLYRRARRPAEGLVDRFDRERRAGRYASATLAGTRALGALRAFEAAIDAIDEDAYTSRVSVDDLATARERAVAALRDAWSTPPAVLSVAVTGLVRDAIRHAHHDLEGAEGDEGAVRSAIGLFAYARLLAETVPETVETVVDLLEAG